ncbi:MAG: nuclease, partial [Pseudomonadota bacterium]|nr:nuclease [Pseudomonadota bacterium]
KSFLVAVNHFKSKGSQCAEDVAEAPSEITTIQGSCNALRVSAAITLGNALSDESLPERKVILGDLNAYSAEDPVAVLTDYTPESRGYTITTAVNTGMDEGSSVDVESSFGYHNLAEEFDAEGFSYWFYGTEQVGSLDHVLASEAMLADAIDGAHWNINSVEAYQLQYDQALRYYPDEDGYAFTDVGPFRSSDHDPFIATFDLQADVVEEEEENNDSSGGAMGGILALLAAAIGFRRRSTTVKK